MHILPKYIILYFYRIIIIRLRLNTLLVFRSPRKISHINRLNKMQNKFLKRSISPCSENYLDLKSETERRVEFNVTFVHTILNGVIDALRASKRSLKSS